MRDLYSELKRRTVVRVGIAYAVGGGLMIELIDTVAARLGMADWAPTFFIVAVLVGFPIALVFSWAYEMTPQGLMKTAEVDADASLAHSTGRRLDFAIIGMLVLALGYFVWDKFGPEPTADTGEVTAEAESGGLLSVAVLPFVNMSSDPEQDYFSDGITEEILNVLVRIKGLRVPSRTSSFAFKDQNLSIRKVADELEVDYILEGSVRKAGPQIRITAQLIDVKTDTHLWSETYDREYADIFKVQDEIAKAIVSALKDTLGVDVGTVSVKALTANIEAYDLFLKAREYFLTRNVLLMNEAVGLFERAIALDPAFAEAHEGLAAVYIVLPGYDLSLSQAASYEKADRVARRALSLDPTLAIAHSIVAQVHGKNHRWEEADVAYDLAHRFGPDNPTVRLWRGLYFLRLGYIEKGHEEFAAGLKADPASGILNAYMGWSFLFGGKAGEALPFAEKALGLGWPYAFLGLSYIHLELGHVATAKQVRQTQSNIPADSVLGGIMTDLLIKPDERVALQERLRALAEENGIDLDAYINGPSWHLIEYGDYEAAAERAFRSDTALQFAWAPRFHEYRQSAAFKDLLRRIGIVDYWNVNGWPNQCRVLAGDDFECD